MTAYLFTQYQTLAQPPSAAAQPGATNASPWLYPWSEPVREKINKTLAVALIASGLFAPTFSPDIEPGADNAAPWLYAWSEPVRIKPQVLAANQEPFFFNPVPIPARDWHQWLSEPVRQKPGLGAWLQDAVESKTPTQPESSLLLEGWYTWFAEPVRLPKGLKVYLQQFLAYHPRVLPPPDVTATMAATETNSDVALIGVQVYNTITPVTAGTSANVSISEIPVENNAAASLRES